VSRHCQQSISPAGGIWLGGAGKEAIAAFDRFESLGIAPYIEVKHGKDGTVFRLEPEVAEELAPNAASIDLCGKLKLSPRENPEDLEREILLAQMLSPVRFNYANAGEFASAINIRKNIVGAAGKTLLAFDTGPAAERPSDCWTYSREAGFTIVPGKSLVEALKKATQPEVSGKLYAFSCYRATEYVILLGLAEELANCNPLLLDRLQKQWETRAIKSCAFHETFLVEYGSMSEPLPPRHYVPGDRLWFRNPDEHSSDVDGFEGSWVFYLGDGLFTNFWKESQPYTLNSKCLEIFHWRDGTYHDRDGNLQMDESVVDAHVQASLADPEKLQEIIVQMMRLREPKGCYGKGGCLDTSREYPRPICPGAQGLSLPDA